MQNEQIEFVIPKGYKKSDKSTDEKLVFELVEGKNIENEAKEFLFDIFNKMKVRIEPDKPGYVYYDIAGMGIVFEQDFKNDTLWVSYTQIWNVFETKFSMYYSEIQSFIKNAVEETLNWKGLTPTLNNHLYLQGGRNRKLEGTNIGQ